MKKMASERFVGNDRKAFGRYLEESFGGIWKNIQRNVLEKYLGNIWKNIWEIFGEPSENLREIFWKYLGEVGFFKIKQRF